MVFSSYSSTGIFFLFSFTNTSHNEASFNILSFFIMSSFKPLSLRLLFEKELAYYCIFLMKIIIILWDRFVRRKETHLWERYLHSDMLHAPEGNNKFMRLWINTGSAKNYLDFYFVMKNNLIEFQLLLIIDFNLHQFFSSFSIFTFSAVYMFISLLIHENIFYFIHFPSHDEQTLWQIERVWDESWEKDKQIF